MPSKKPKTADRDEPLTENEGSLLGVVARMQPMTTYQLLKVYETSPVSSFNSSKGGVYKTVRNLKARGLLSVEPIEGDARNAEMLSCTEAGIEMIRLWVKDLKMAQTLIFDPFRTRVLSLDLLPRDEQIEWVIDAKNLISEKIALVDRYSGSVNVPFQEVVHMGSVGPLKEKISWLERLLTIIVKESPGGSKAGRT